MARAKVKISAKSGRSGTKVAGGTIKVKHGNGRGKPMFQTKAQMTAHFYYGQRPAKTQLRRAN